MGAALFALSSAAQISRLGEGVEYKAEAAVMGATGDVAPLWLSANRHGLSSTENSAAYARGAIERKIENDTTQRWKFGYGLDLVVPYNYTSHFVVQQLYAEAQFLKFRVSFGSKERDMLFENDELSSGGMTFSTNARPVPQLRAELVDWWNITGKANFLSIKGHLAYGRLTDGNWQERFVGGESSHILHSSGTLYHSKAGYFRFGNEKRFPLTGMFGLEMVAEFGGEVWNLVDRTGSGNENFESHQKLGQGVRDFWNAFLPGGADVNDGPYANANGNQLGSWVFSLDWNEDDWGVRAYMDHFFEDHSMMFFQYGWRDNLIGLEARLPKNRFVSNIVYEHLNTTDQSGSVYHDTTSELPIQISGKDTYYNHHIYGAYQHWGQVMGTPLILSPIYNGNQRITAYHNRVKAHHIGLDGNPTSEFSWRLLISHERSFGTYDLFVEDNSATHLLGVATYKPRQLKGWQFALSYGSTMGSLMGDSHGFEATVRKTGLIKKRNSK